MPGIRKKSKRSFGFYWERSEIALLKTGAEAMGLDMSSYVKLLVHAQTEAAKNGVAFDAFANALREKADRKHMTFNDYVKAIYGDDAGKGTTR